MNTTTSVVRSRKPRDLTPEQFDKLLATLAADRESAAEEYEQLRRALMTFFEFRGALQPADEADEVIDRVARRLDEGREIFTAHPRNYFYAVARNVWRERLASPVTEVELAAQVLPAFAQARNPLELLEASEAEQIRLQRLQCLQSCLQQLEETERALIVSYYEGSGGDKIRNRQALALRLGIPVTTLRVRACRLREKLETRVRRCLQRSKKEK
ncbi:MAG: sigma-70 family RNA polymerase sigma factor [Acidobacteria bacterium]|nr:sigma-70 family RNA polymerase sigma factor [Acidobacteriota bacterium]MBI3425890.1 sigma-70 family RNA polymerase sigma factor [Acidobacteriota bacterium]